MIISGVALFDADGDGWLDTYFVNGAALKPAMSRGELPVKDGAVFQQSPVSQ